MRIFKLRYTDKEAGIADLIAKGVLQEMNLNYTLFVYARIAYDYL